MNSPKYRYGLYLRPPAVISRIQSEIHELMKRQYGLVSAGAFPPHMTILGHVATRDDHQEVIDAATAAMDGVHAVRIFNRGLGATPGHGIGHIVGSLPNGDPNPALVDLFRRASQHLDPLRVPVEGEYKPGVRKEADFYGHMTLAAHDLTLRPELFDEVFAFLSELDIGARGEYICDTAALYVYETNSGWDGKWWETMTWTLLKSFHLE